MKNWSTLTDDFWGQESNATKFLDIAMESRNLESRQGFWKLAKQDLRCFWENDQLERLFVNLAWVKTNEDFLSFINVARKTIIWIRNILSNNWVINVGTSPFDPISLKQVDTPSTARNDWEIKPSFMARRQELDLIERQIEWDAIGIINKILQILWEEEVRVLKACQKDISTDYRHFDGRILDNRTKVEEPGETDLIANIWHGYSYHNKGGKSVVEKLIDAEREWGSEVKTIPELMAKLGFSDITKVTSNFSPIINRFKTKGIPCPFAYNLRQNKFQFLFAWAHSAWAEVRRWWEVTLELDEQKLNEPYFLWWRQGESVEIHASEPVILESNEQQNTKTEKIDISTWWLNHDQAWIVRYLFEKKWEFIASTEVGVATGIKVQNVFALKKDYIDPINAVLKKNNVGYQITASSGTSFRYTISEV